MFFLFIQKESKKHIEHAAALAQLKENRTQMGQDSEARGTALSGNAALDAEMKANFAKMIPKEQLEKRKRKWVDTTPEPALNGNQQHVKSEAASQVAVTNETASMAKPINTAATANKPPALPCQSSIHIRQRRRVQTKMCLLPHLLESHQIQILRQCLLRQKTVLESHHRDLRS